MDEPNSKIPANAISDPPARTTTDQVLSGMLYGLSLPERLVRSAVGLTAGTAREIAEFVVPQAFQNSKTYEVAIRNSLNFLLANVGTVTDSSAVEGTTNDLGTTDSPAPAADPNDPAQGNPGKFIARKALGNFIDIAGLATLHVSPLWILAIVSDTAYGTKTYLNELAEELKKQGLIDESSTIHKVDDLFHAVSDASGKAASNFDQPPLSLEELRKSFEQTRAALNEVDPKLLIPESEISRFWNDMKQVASQENVSLLGVSGAVAMQTVESIRNVSQGTLTGLFVAGKIVNRNIFGHYWTSLGTIRRNGIWQSVKDSYAPYVDLAWGNFVSSRKSWTEQILCPSRFQRGWGAIKRWFSRKPESASTAAATPNTDSGCTSEQQL